LIVYRDLLFLKDEDGLGREHEKSQIFFFLCCLVSEYQPGTIETLECSYENLIIFSSIFANYSEEKILLIE